MGNSDKNSEEKHKILHEHTSLCFQSLSEDGIIKDVNPVWLRTLGYHSDEVIGNKFKDFLHPECKAQFEENLKKPRNTKDVELKIRHKNGKYIDVAFEGSVSYLPDGSFEQTYCIFQDITELKKAQYNSTFLSNAVFELNQFKTPKEVFVYTVNKLYELFNKSIIITGVEYDNPNNKWKMHEVKGINSFIDNGLKKIGLDIRNLEGPIDTRFLEDVEEGKFIELEFDLHSLTNGKISGNLNNAVKKIVPVKKLLVIPIKKKEFIYGTITLVITKRSIEIEKQLNETFITQIAVFVEKLIIESELRENETKLKAAEKIAHVGNYEIDINTGAAIWSEETFRIFGLEYIKGKELMSDEYSKLVLPGDSLKLYKHFEECISEVKPFNLVYRIIRSDNEIRYVHSIGEFETNERGVPVKMFGTLQDITEEIFSEQKLRESEERFNLAMKASNDGIFDRNLVTNEIYYSPKWKSILGFEDHELPNDFSIWENLTQPEDRKKSWEMQQELIFKKRDRFVMEFKMKHKDGHWVDILSRAEAVFDENDKAIRIVGTHQDISERKRFEAELVEAKQKAEESDRLKSAFLANMSHEIRTPMNGILGFTRLLQIPGLTGDQQQSYVEIIQKSGDRMLNTVNDIIEISKIDAGQVSVSLGKVNVLKQLNFIYHFFKPEAEKKGMQLVLNTTLPVDESVILTDELKLDSILINLVKNAIKYSYKGTIKISCDKKDDKLKFSVKDTGIGIPQNRLEAIFDRFVQADIEDRHVREGSGLGLAIVKSYVDMLGGKIWVESEVDIGSTFYFTIDYNQVVLSKKPEENKNNKIAEKKLKEISILVAEDDEVSYMLIENILPTENCRLIKVNNGKDAVELCKNNPDLDLILMDLKMPKLDGINATKKIREFNKKIPIIAQTAYALAGDKEKALDAGCNDYISKPINKEELIGKIGNFTSAQ